MKQNIYIKGDNQQNNLLKTYFAIKNYNKNNIAETNTNVF